MQKSIISSVALGSCPVMAQSGAGATSDSRASLPEEQRRQGTDSTMGRIVGFLFGGVAYVVFLGAFLYAIGFVAGMVVPKAIDDGTIAPVEQVPPCAHSILSSSEEGFPEEETYAAERRWREAAEHLSVHVVSPAATPACCSRAGTAARPG